MQLHSLLFLILFLAPFVLSVHVHPSVQPDVALVPSAASSPLHAGTQLHAEPDVWPEMEQSEIDMALIENMGSTIHRLSTPYLHELKEKHSTSSSGVLPPRATSPKHSLEALIAPLMKPAQQSTLQHGADARKVNVPSEQEARALRAAHMKHVMDLKKQMEAKHKQSLKSTGHISAAAAVAQEPSANTTVFDHEVKKSPYDNRSYRFITLSNGLKAVLVSDPETTKSAAAMDVGNGYLSDPDDIPGMAHFLEHMLFLGTEKYPSESEYADFIEAHGGFSNAYTAMENTNYYFDILPTHLEGALDRFAQFFIAPLLTVGSTQREMNAVDSEHSKNLLSDAWRTNRLLQELSNLTHPYHKFGTGCSQTLDTMPHEQMRERLLEFYNKHYTAGNLNLAIVGTETLDELQALVERTFSAVKPSVQNYRPLANTDYKQVFPDTTLRHQVYVKTIEDTKFFALIFPMESQFPTYTHQSLAYLKHFIEQRAHGSLQKQLKSRGWITSIAFSVDAGTSAFATVQFAAELTDEGTKHIHDIIQAFFHYLKVLQNKGVNRWRYNELAALANLTFSLKDKEHPGSYASKLASSLKNYPPEDLLTGGRLFMTYSKANIRQILDRLTPDNMIVLIGGSKINKELPLRERWYNIEYAVEPIQKKWLKRYKKASSKFDFSLPAKNKFVQYNVTTYPLLEPKISKPIILHESSKPNARRLWYSQDVDFLRPHGHVVFRLYAPFIYATARNYLLTNIYVNLLEDQIDEDLYPALVAGFSSHFRVGTCYLDLIFYGYNSGLLSYAKSVARIMNPVRGKFKPNPERFKAYKEALLNNYLNKKFDAPHKQSTKLFSTLLDPNTISPYDMINTLHSIEFQDVQQWARVLFNDMSLEAFVHGNLYPSHAISLLDTFSKHLPFNTTTTSFVNSPTRNHQFKRPRVGKVMENYAVVQHAPNPAETNSAILDYWQFGMASLEFKLYAQMLALIIQKPCFHQLRTVEQLGYIVWSGVDTRLDVYGFKIQVQSGKKDAGYLHERIVSFTRQFQETLANLTQKQFETYVETLMMTKLEAPISMAMQTSWFWNEIAKQEYIFQRKEIELYLLNQTNFISREGFLQFVNKLFYISNPANPGVESCETYGGGALSVRIESPVDRGDDLTDTSAVAKASAKPHSAKPSGSDSSSKVTKVGGKKKKKVSGTPLGRLNAKKQKAQAAKSDKKAAAKPSPPAQSAAPAKSMLQVDATSELIHKLEVQLEHDHELDVEAENEQAADNTAAIQDFLEAQADQESEVDSDSESDVSALEFDDGADENVFLEVESLLEPHSPDHAHALPHVAATTNSPANVAQHAAVMSVDASGKTKSSGALFQATSKKDLAPTDPEILVLITVRTGSMFLLNITQSTVHMFTDSLQMYPRNKYLTPVEPLAKLPEEPAV